MELSQKVDLEKEIIAFLNNQEGGMIYIGVDNDGNKIGVNHPDQLMLTIKDRIKNNVSPSAMGLFDIVLEDRDGLDIIRSEEHTSELQSRGHLVCRLLL